MNNNNLLHSLHVGLPDDIARLKAAGYYDEACRLIDLRLVEWERSRRGAAKGENEADPMPSAPEAMRDCLLAEKEIMRRIPEEYPYNEADAIHRVQNHIPNFTANEFRALVDADRIDWRFIKGQKRYSARFYETLTDTDAAFAARTGKPQKFENLELRRKVAKQMQENGAAAARITVKFTICASEKAFSDAMLRAAAKGKKSVNTKVWLPMPAACPAQSEIELIDASKTPDAIAPETAPQRTIYWEQDLARNTAFTATYSYIQTASYTDPMACASEMRHAPVSYLEPESCLGEQAPHVMFTPYLRALAAELTAGCTNDTEKASRIYDFVTLHVRYRYEPYYFILENLPDACVRNRFGDCGIQALTFITLCRIAGVPAVWQSGLMAGPKTAGSHDWAMFYLQDKGWLYADCSFGGGAAEVGDEALRRHYFGNLDPYRMVANRAFEAPLAPEKLTWRNDPYDNQSGEIELEGVGLYGDDYDATVTLVSAELL